MNRTEPFRTTTPEGAIGLIAEAGGFKAVFSWRLSRGVSWCYTLDVVGFSSSLHGSSVGHLGFYTSEPANETGWEAGVAGLLKEKVFLIVSPFGT